MKKVTKNLFKGLAVLCTIIMVVQVAMTVEAVKYDEYLNREVEWSGKKCTAKTEPAGAGRPYYAVATVFLYDGNDVCIISDSHEQTIAGANATASARHSSVARARAYHYITSQPNGAGTAYGFIYEDVDTETNI